MIFNKLKKKFWIQTFLTKSKEKSKSLGSYCPKKEKNLRLIIGAAFVKSISIPEEKKILISEQNTSFLLQEICLKCDFSFKNHKKLWTEYQTKDYFDIISWVSSNILWWKT